MAGTLDFATRGKLALRNANQQTGKKGQLIFAVESFIQISISLVSKEKRLKFFTSRKLSTQANLIWLAHGKFFTQMLDRITKFSKYFSKATDNTKKQSMKCFLQSKCTFKNVIFSTAVFQECLKFLEKSAASSTEEDTSSLCDKWMQILKVIFYRFQLFNHHFKGIQIFLRTFSFHFKVLKGVFSWKMNV